MTPHALQLAFGEHNPPTLHRLHTLVPWHTEVGSCRAVASWLRLDAMSVAAATQAKVLGRAFDGDPLTRRREAVYHWRRRRPDELERSNKADHRSGASRRGGVRR